MTTDGSAWALRARGAITDAIIAGESAGEDVATIIRRIDRAYPFGPREHHPYKMWLRERRIAVDRLLGPTPTVGPVGQRQCPVCGVGPGIPCVVMGEECEPGEFHVGRYGGT